MSSTRQNYEKLMTEHHHRGKVTEEYDLETVKARLKRIVIGVDPAVTSGEGSNETGIIVAGINGKGIGYVLEDVSAKCPATQWGERILTAYQKWEADRVVAEVNQGGDLVESMLRALDPTLSYKGVRATRGKRIRAEPIAALYEAEKIFHLHAFETLEKQLCSFENEEGREGTDRLDALVWAMTDLMLHNTGPKRLPRAYGFAY